MLHQHLIGGSLQLTGILPDFEIVKMTGMIEPFIDHQVRDGVISYGLSSFGYDVRLSTEFMSSELETGYLDPKHGYDKFNPLHVKDVCFIDAHGFILGQSIEYIKMPRDVMAIAVGKSTYARCGVVVNVTPLEAGWEGHITIEISNTGSLPVVVYPNEGILQLLFFRAEVPCRTSYADRHGKYQGQTSVTPSRV